MKWLHNLSVSSRIRIASPPLQWLFHVFTLILCTRSSSHMPLFSNIPQIFINEKIHFFSRENCRCIRVAIAWICRFFVGLIHTALFLHDPSCKSIEWIEFGLQTSAEEEKMKIIIEWESDAFHSGGMGRPISNFVIQWKIGRVTILEGATSSELFENERSSRGLKFWQQLPIHRMWKFIESGDFHRYESLRNERANQYGSKLGTKVEVKLDVD